MYSKVPGTLAAALDAKAAQVRGRDAQGAACLEQHAATLRGTDPLSIARGANLFPPHLMARRSTPRTSRP